MQERKGEHVCEKRSITDLSDQNQKENKSELLNTQQKSKKSLVFVIATSPLFLYNTQNYLIKILIVIIAMLNVCKLQA